MDPIILLVVGLVSALSGASVGALVARRGAGVASRTSVAPEADEFEVSAESVAILAALRSGAVVLGPNDKVLSASPSSRALGFVRDDEVVHAPLLDMAREVRRDNVVREDEIDVMRGPIGSGSITVGLRAAPLAPGRVLLLIEDRTQAKRVEAVRRDFVANVSHELKTPVGGISLLAEAVLDANEDPEAVARFARRIKIESTRLTHLVQEIVDLSRLQAAESLSDPAVVDIDEVVQDAVDQMLLLAEAKRMSFRVSVQDGLAVYGDASMLVTAIGNLLSNAIAYSQEHTRVTVAARAVDDVVEISVADQGRGISPSDQERVFERFYRVDTARSRSTGGTGLGLAIVKHICSNHGGEVKLWSREGHGSTFTIRLPSVGRRQNPLDPPTESV
ncbi:sensor histidine kinase [Gephyromycinifex aptenodytis]|uniref:sensor histidine kinase n=1 Tax=Gephyromycinifex aptenodytis TaxID=2716227 RepID=UPI001D015BFA|nr:ATP-binding protein [Gephyromycinifex aptenodytis]